MFFRNALLVLGVFCILGGVAIGYVWLTNQDASVEVAKPEVRAPEPQQPARIAVMSASRDIASGTLLQPGDILWKEIAPSELRPGNLARGQASEAEFAGALAKRDFANGEALNASDLLKQNDRRFLAAALKPGARAISIPVDAAQSAYGLIEPGNYVDVILTQSLSDQPGDAKRKVVAETILQNIRVIAVDQTLTQQARTPLGSALSTEPRLPKTVTLELTKQQAETVFVALQLGRLQFSLRSIEEVRGAAADHAEHRTATWAGDVSPALRQMPHAPLQGPASSLESSIRRPPGSLQ
jgi:pilus assembly protein CpaB